MDNKLNINEDSYNRISTTTKLTHALMKIALGMKSGRVSLAIVFYNAFNLKLLLLDITDSYRIMAEIHNNKLNYLLESIHQRTFYQRTIQKLMDLIVEARKLPGSTYTILSEEIFDKDQVTDDDKELDDTTDTNKELRENFLQSALDMKKTFLVQCWTNKVFTNILAIGIQTPEVLLHHIAHGTLNPLLNQHGYLTMNHSTSQILVDALPCFFYHL